MKNFIAVVLFIVVSIPSIFSLSPWVESFGTDSPYTPPLYVTGFGTAPRNMGDSEALEASRNLAMDDLIRKIQVHIKSEITMEMTDIEGDYSSSVAVVTQSVSSLNLSGLDFLLEKDRRNQYTLAYAKVSRLRDIYIDRGREILTAILEGYQRGSNFLVSGRGEDALEEFVKILPLFPDLLECRAIYKGLPAESETRRFFYSLGNMEYQDLQSILLLEQETKRLIHEVEGQDPITLDDVLSKIVTMLEIQGVWGKGFYVSALLYQNSDFSSPFGNYISHHLEPVIQSRLSAGGRDVVIRGTYWEKGSEIELLVIAQDRDTGEKLGSGYSTLPRFSIPKEYKVKPQNFEQALVTQRELADGALADGGISLEMWTNRGRNEDVLVFSEEEILEIYFRVNQPAYLQLTYNLATGENVLLEESFYLGIDQVNQVVRYPYAFSIVSPLGVERLMVTAYSVKPPSPNIVPEIIDGEEYQVFSSTKAVVALTRGLRRQQTEGNSDVKMGEAFLTITTVPE